MNTIAKKVSKGKVQLTAIIYRDALSNGDPIYSALCPEIDVATQGYTVEDARSMLQEAVELFLECADDAEIDRRFHEEVYVTQFEAELPIAEAVGVG